jgi:hypothetical protein
MIPEDSPNFTELLKIVNKANQEYNALKFE